MIHSVHKESGQFDKLEIDRSIEENNVKMVELSVKPGDTVHPFSGANKSLGDMFLRFDSRKELDEIMNKADEWLNIILK